MSNTLRELILGNCILLKLKREYVQPFLNIMHPVI